MDRPNPYQNGCGLSIGANPGDLFAPFGSLQKGLAAGAAKSPPIKRYGTNPVGGGKPPPYRGASSDTRHTMIRHCEEGHRPDVAIRSPVKRERIPTAPPGPRNDGMGMK